jgi:TRAP-type C4-dicarboxylate transport system permease small subunit
MRKLSKPIQDDPDIFVALTAEEAAAPDPPADLAAEDWISVALFWALAGCVFLQFFTRYILNNSLTWTEEIAGYLLMVLTFTGSAMAARRGTHIAVEFLPNMLPASARRWVFLAAGLVATAFHGICIWLSFQVAQAMQFQPMIALDHPLSIIYWGILAGLVLTTLRSLDHALRRFRRGEPEAAPDPSAAGVKI